MKLIIVHVFSANPYRTPLVKTPRSTALSSEFEFAQSTCTASSPDLVPMAPFPQNPHPSLNLLLKRTPIDVELIKNHRYMYSFFFHFAKLFLWPDIRYCAIPLLPVGTALDNEAIIFQLTAAHSCLFPVSEAQELHYYWSFSSLIHWEEKCK